MDPRFAIATQDARFLVATIYNSRHSNDDYKIDIQASSVFIHSNLFWFSQAIDIYIEENEIDCEFDDYGVGRFLFNFEEKYITAFLDDKKQFIIKNFQTSNQADEYLKSLV